MIGSSNSFGNYFNELIKEQFVVCKQMQEEFMGNIISSGVLPLSIYSTGSYFILHIKLFDLLLSIYQESCWCCIGFHKQLLGLSVITFSADDGCMILDEC